MTFKNENYKIKVYGTAAKAVYDEMVYSTDGKLLIVSFATCGKSKCWLGKS